MSAARPSSCSARPREGDPVFSEGPGLRFPVALGTVFVYFIVHKALLLRPGPEAGGDKGFKPFVRRVGEHLGERLVNPGVYRFPTRHFDEGGRLPVIRQRMGAVDQEEVPGGPVALAVSP